MDFTDLSGKIVVVTGATEGIGEAITEKLIADGMKVIAVARSAKNLATLEQKYGDKLHAVALDISDTKAVMEFPARLPPEWQNVYALVNNAGTTGAGKRLEGMDTADIEQVLATNTKGPVLLSKALLPALQKNHGHVVNIGSVSGNTAYEMGHVYSASKAALEAFSNNLRLENIKHGMRVSLIKAGPVRTGIHRKRFAHNAALAEKVESLPDQMRPSDVAGTVAYCLKQPPEVSIDELTVTPTGTRFARGTERYASMTR